MSQIEFETVVQEGLIAVPKEHTAHVRGRVRVIIIVEEDDDALDMVEYLMEHPLVATTTTLLSRDDLHTRHD